LCTIIVVFPCERLVLHMSPVKWQYPALRMNSDKALVYTMRELNQQTARIMGLIEKTGKPAFITRQGRFIALITPFAPGQVESRVLTAMTREIGKLH
jgi:antitoxin (DNA-binding transcriptional repressor) of toxin-antitoxin stability system